MIEQYEKEANDDNIKQSLQEDLLHRNEFVLRFLRLLNSIDGPCTIAVDAPWGEGKTFFVRQVQMLLDTANGQCSHKVLEEKELSKLTGAELSQELYSNPQMCVYYDAWANDQDEDPLLSLVSEILLGINERYHGTEAFTHGRNLRDLAGSIIELITGRNVKGIQETVSGKDYLKQIEERRNLQEKVNEFLDNVTNERGNRLVIFIDELDRCSPVFAVRLLERVKHYFNREKITFVFSVHLAELQNTVRAYYGENFNGAAYLDRFFDLRIEIPKTDYSQFYSEIGLQGTDSDGNTSIREVCLTFAKLHQFSLRSTMRYWSMVRIAEKNLPKDSGYYLVSAEQ